MLSQIQGGGPQGRPLFSLPEYAAFSRLPDPPPSGTMKSSKKKFSKLHRLINKNFREAQKQFDLSGFNWSMLFIVLAIPAIFR